MPHNKERAEIKWEQKWKCVRREAVHIAWEVEKKLELWLQVVKSEVLQN